ncbi:MAG: hypothetical protein WC623_21910 [Pedobacter sp.]|uniref:hypothetical protein n=1 Tax=Pedobacter sp. TaxID=1411316 RepID=UPI0035674346
MGGFVMAIYTDDIESTKLATACPHDTISTHQANRLIYFGDIKLFDYDKYPEPEDGYEKLRNLTLHSVFSKIVKKYPDVIVHLPIEWCRLHEVISKRNLRNRFQDSYSNKETIEKTDEYEVDKYTATRYEFKIKEIKRIFDIPMRQLYQNYLDLPIPISDMWQSKIIFHFNVPDKPYRIGFTLDGKIVSIKRQLIPSLPELTAKDIICMSDWANKEFADIVTDAKICKIVEREEEPEEPETNTSYECEI